jgi:hypothetical protein
MSDNVQLAITFETNIDVCNITAMKEYFSSTDCMSRSGTGMSALRHRSHYSYRGTETPPIRNQFGVIDDPSREHCACFQMIHSEYDLCLDEFCNLPSSCESTSADRVPPSLLLPTETSSKTDACMYILVSVASNETSCSEEVRCNWNPSLLVTPSTPSLCVGDGLSDSFCGVHFDPDDPFYHEVYNFTEEECKNQNGQVCVTPFGSLLVGNISDEACSAAGYCTAYCPKDYVGAKCVPIHPGNGSSCISNTTDKNSCLQMSGKWVMDVCTLPLQSNREECKRNGNQFIQCEDLTVDDCFVSSHPPCYVSTQDAPCHSKIDCETHGQAWCSNREIFFNYAKGYRSDGACVVPYQKDGNRSYCYVFTSPLNPLG